MSPRQLLRLYESRKSGTFDDQKTPAEIQASETSSADHEEFLDFVLSQIRQILGTLNWHDPVPAQLAELVGLRATIPANCLVSDAPGNAVFVTGPEVGGRVQVTTANILSYDTMPACGILVSKSSDTTCEIQCEGEIRGVFTGLTPRKVYFLGEDGRPTDVPPAPAADHYVQKLGIALSTDVLLVQASTDLVKRRV